MKFKLDDRVRYINELAPGRVGRTGVITKVWPHGGESHYGVKWDDPERGGYSPVVFEAELEALPPREDDPLAPREGPPSTLSPRAKLLRDVEKLVTGDRNNQYGPPTQDFRRTSEAANAYGYRGPGGRRLLPHDIAILVKLVKLSRITWQPTKEDSWADDIGYSACGWECVQEEIEKGELT